MIQISHLTIQFFDLYDGTYSYLVEVFDKNPEDQDANFLATGVCSKKALFDEKITYPKGEPDQVYIKLVTPIGYQITAPVTLTPGNDNVCTLDPLAVSWETTATPVSRTPTRNVFSTCAFIIEDSFLNYGDYGSNDTVIRAQMETSTKDDYVQFANIKLIFRALGGAKWVGAFIHPPDIKSKDIQKVESSGWTTTPESEIETPVYALSDDIHELSSSYEMVNTNNDLPYRGEQGRPITPSFAAGALRDLTIDDIDLFTTVLKREGEVLHTETYQHNYSYTPKGVRYRCYSSDNYIWALMIPNDFKYPVEHTLIDDVHPDLLKQVGGGGKYVQWYKSKNTIDKWIYAREQ